MTGRIYRLTEIHQRIDDRLRQEGKRKLPNWLEMTRLKRMKLRIKDRIHRLMLRPQLG